MHFNVRLFFKINALLGTNRWLDAFGRAGAEWAILAMVAWYGVATIVDQAGDQRQITVQLLTFAVAWLAGWFMSIAIGLLVQEPRPHVTYPESKLLFKPKMSWKSFPSDHAMTAWLIFFLGVAFNVSGVEALLLLALWVSWGRVFAGVHYPFDIIGGFLVALLMALASVNLLIFFL